MMTMPSSPLLALFCSVMLCSLLLPSSCTAWRNSSPISWNRLRPLSSVAGLQQGQPSRRHLSSGTATMSSSSSSSTIIPRAAVSIVVRWSLPEDKSNPKPRYVLVQRGQEPNKGLWSLPGGKIDCGESTLSAAQRELHEETQLPNHDCESSTYRGDKDAPVLHWHTAGPFQCSDAIHKDEVTGQVLFHYVISQCFCVVHHEATTVHAKTTSPPMLVPSDDAADAQWWDLARVHHETNKGRVTPGIAEVLQRSEELHQKGMLRTTSLDHSEDGLPSARRK